LIGDPLGTGLVTSLAKPGGNLTGLSSQTTDLVGKRFELLRELVPSLRRLTILFNVNNPGAALEIESVRKVALPLGVDVLTSEIRPAEDIAPDGRLARCSTSDTCPKIFEVNSANEYWAKNMAVSLADAQGKASANEPANVRSYFMASLPHQGGLGATGRGMCQQNRNPLVANAVLRALLVAMDQWVTSGTEPPASRLPNLANGTLVQPLPQDGQGFPHIPGVKYNGRMHTGDLFDYGPKFEVGVLTILPPRLVGTPYSALVPRTDSDGNDVAGIRLPEVAVPLATYTGWNLRAVPAGGDDGCDHWGQQIEFARTKAERTATGDPRPSLEERYPTQCERGCFGGERLGARSATS
jgi:hypothetical protein